MACQIHYPDAYWPETLMLPGLAQINTHVATQLTVIFSAHTFEVDAQPDMPMPGSVILPQPRRHTQNVA